jgi:hypothetical protein
LGLAIVEFLAEEACLVKDIIHSVKYVVVEFLHNVYRRCYEIKGDSYPELHGAFSDSILTEEKNYNINSLMQLNSSHPFFCPVALAIAGNERGVKWR